MDHEHERQLTLNGRKEREIVHPAVRYAYNEHVTQQCLRYYRMNANRLCFIGLFERTRRERACFMHTLTHA